MQFVLIGMEIFRTIQIKSVSISKETCRRRFLLRQNDFHVALPQLTRYLFWHYKVKASAYLVV